MNRFELNKIIAAITLTVVIVFGIDKLADVIYKVEKPKSTSYKIASSTQEINTETKNADLSGDIKSLLAQGSVDHGKSVFKKCAGCHSINKGGGNKIGPALWGVMGRQIGSIENYKYSKAMASFGKVWNFETINAFLLKPKDYMKGTKMAYAGLKKEKDRASVILYLNEQTGTPLQLP